MKRKTFLSQKALHVTVAAMTAWLVTGVGAVQQPKIRTLSEQEIMDMMLGSSIQASRGANTPQTMQRMKAALDQGRKFTMIDVDDLPADWNTVTVACRLEIAGCLYGSSGPPMRR